MPVKANPFTDDVTIAEPHMAFDLSVILVSYNHKEVTVECISSIFKAAATARIEVIVVDNASVDGAGDTIEALFPSVRLIRNVTNEGFAVAVNQAIKVGNGRHLMLLNNDTVVRVGALEAMMHFLDTRKDAGAVGCRLIDDKGHLWPSSHELPTFRILLAYWLLNRSGKARRRWGNAFLKFWTYDSLREVPFLSGACLMVRREVIEQIGFMDEAFAMYVEDVDWCIRIRQAGWRIFFLPDATIVHIGGQSSKPIHRRYMYYGSLLTLSKKYYSFREHCLARAYWRLWRMGLRVALLLAGYRGLDRIGYLRAHRPA